MNISEHNRPLKPPLGVWALCVVGQMKSQPSSGTAVLTPIPRVPAKHLGTT